MLQIPEPDITDYGCPQSHRVRVTLIKAGQYQYNTKITLTDNSFSDFFLLKIYSHSWRGRIPYDFAPI